MAHIVITGIVTATCFHSCYNDGIKGGLSFMATIPESLARWDLHCIQCFGFRVHGQRNCKTCLIIRFCKNPV